MGGDLKTAPAGKAPTFLVAALKDATSGNLDRIQIIKGWLDKSGKPQEKIYDVVWGDCGSPPDRERQADAGRQYGGCRDRVVDEHDRRSRTRSRCGRIRTSIRRSRAFYYARVLEIPTPRWTAYDAAYFKIKITDPKVPMTTQERAFTSPIWYTPN